MFCLDYHSQTMFTCYVVLVLVSWPVSMVLVWILGSGLVASGCFVPSRVDSHWGQRWRALGAMSRADTALAVVRQ